MVFLVEVGERRGRIWGGFGFERKGFGFFFAFLFYFIGCIFFLLSILIIR